MPGSNICTERFYFLSENVCHHMYFYGMDKVDANEEDIFIHIFEVVVFSNSMGLFILLLFLGRFVFCHFTKGVKAVFILLYKLLSVPPLSHVFLSKFFS